MSLKKSQIEINRILNTSNKAEARSLLNDSQTSTNRNLDTSSRAEARSKLNEDQIELIRKANNQSFNYKRKSTLTNGNEKKQKENISKKN